MSQINSVIKDATPPTLDKMNKESFLLYFLFFPKRIKNLDSSLHNGIGSRRNAVVWRLQ